ncbi:helicase-related protein [Caulobacter sp. S45]|uniref:helicase-related protein n=1 Tax=Caulobacter sp. S45 TaxID=1641861 RepID=UPI00131B03CF|nr:helicase-related protein [Caulobacter sp. S45]
MADRPSGAAPSRLVAVLGPTNTGKTHLAVERMLGHASGMIGLPLRLLAREIYDRIVKLRGARAVALITGEEKIVPPRATYFVCTVEAMPLTREVEFLAVDEIQLCADPARGHVFTHRLLHARGKYETMFLGASTIAPLIRRLLPEAEFVTRERFSSLTYAGSKKLTRLPRRSAVVAFSTENVYAIAELIRRQRGGAAVVMGSLSPRTRNAQVALYQSGEVDFLVATDAIGMGLNMDVDHVAFAGLRKFDGKRTRWLLPQEIGQIAGRAGRYRTDGTFGVTGEAAEIDEDLVAAVEEHQYEPLRAAEWRSPDLDFNSLKALMRSLAAPPKRDGLKLAEESLDETTLRQLAKDPALESRLGRDRARLRQLWEVCQTPDFRKTTLDEHIRLCRTVFDHLSSRSGRLPEEWIAGQFASLDRTEGEMDVLAQRLAGVRTLAYAANRPGWLGDPEHWQAKMRGLEDRLSDTLHEKLMQRFIDRRTSALLRGLNLREEVLAGVAADGAVTVEGHYVGRLRGLRFEIAEGGGQLEDKALRAAAQRAVAPEVTRRLGALAADADEAFAIGPDGAVSWNGEEAGRLSGGRPFAPQCVLYGEMGPPPARERAKRRLEAFVAAEAGRRLAPLKALEDALADGGVRGLARGIAYRLAEAGGVLERGEVSAEVAALSQGERRLLRKLGVRFGAYALYLPGLRNPEAKALLQAFAGVEAPRWRPSCETVVALPSPPPSARTLGWRGLARCGDLAAPVELLEALDALIRSAPQAAGGVRLADEALDGLGLAPGMGRRLLKALGYVAAKRVEAGELPLWRRRAAVPRANPPAPRPPSPDNPFAALAALKSEAVPPRRRRRQRPRKPRQAAASA